MKEAHRHKCGYSLDVFDPHAGCGHEWEHPDSCALLPRPEFAKAHQCPNCGRKGWTSKFEESKGRSIAHKLNEFLDSLEAK